MIDQETALQWQADLKRLGDKFDRVRALVVKWRHKKGEHTRWCQWACEKANGPVCDVCIDREDAADELGAALEDAK